jgi:Tol biopolymer transport system component
MPNKSITSWKFSFLLIFSIILVSILYNTTFAQFDQFGQNKVQYHKFHWLYLKSKHFDIYFYEGGDHVAQFTAAVAESSLVRLTDNIGYEIKNRIPIVVFNSHNEFQENNVLDEYLPEGVGGVTELFKNRVTIPFEGDYSMFRHVISHELLHAYMNDMYYGGSLQNIISQNIRLQFPIWFNEGMAEYQSLEGNDKANDMFMRDGVIYDYIPPLDYLDGYLAYRGGQNFFAWLAEKYGKEKIGDLMLQIKAAGDVDQGFKDVYKFNLEDLSKKWIKYLKETYWPDISKRQEVTDFATRITNHKEGDGFYNTAPAISPKGDKIVYISNRNDYFDLLLADVKTGRIIDKLVAGNKTANFEELHLLTPGLCWSPDSKKIAISVKAGDKDAIFIIDVESGDREELPVQFEGIFSVNWNPTNNSLVFVGDDTKQSDIWIYNLDTKKLQRITNDIYSDADPTWSRDGKKIFFSSDRDEYSDTTQISGKLNFSEYLNARKDIFMYDMTDGSVKRIIEDKYANKSNVESSPDGKKLLYISDKNGINNIWMKDLDSGTEKPITNSIDPINILSLSSDGKRLAFSTLNEGGYDIFYMDNPFDVDIKMKDLPNTIFVQKQIAEREEEAKQDSIKLAKELHTKDSLEDHRSSGIFSFLDSLKSAKIDSTSLYGHDITLNLNMNLLDTLKLQNRKKNHDDNPKFNVQNNVDTAGSLKVSKYKIKFSPDIIYSNVNYSALYGVQGVVQMSFSDLLGNHRIYIVTSLVLDLKNSDYGFAYYYLPNRINLGFEAFHTARFLLINDATTGYIDNLFRYRTYGFNLHASFPFSKFNRLDGSLAFNTLTKENLDNPNQPSEDLRYLLPMVSYVHDNTLFGMTAPIRGSRYNLSLLGTPRIGTSGVSFLSAVGDYRTYLRFLNDYDFVFRFNGGFSVGKNPQLFYLGGTENWINYQVRNNQFPIADIKDFAFATPIFPLRGYMYDAASGTRFFLFNAELRYPLFRYLILGLLPIGFQNIQGVTFMDVGSVWSNNKTLQFFTRGENNNLLTRDLLVGIGTGMRIFFLYFPLKLDVAWSYNFNRFSPPVYYISLGSDF